MAATAHPLVHSPNRLVGGVFGAVYVLVGAVGFAITRGADLAATSGPQLIIFELNPLHNVVHVLVGGLLAGAALGAARASRVVNTLVGAVYLVVGVAGFFVAGSHLNILAVNQPDNLLHLASAALLLGVGLTR
ncbi:DUF4383 domain-containing protein [Gandjariella thermophila]|uniref:DUF4383 domain-containing protein n=1 Tax=Gandjariella thermophila TaxID=1931992 RepID=A0A4D4JEB4_9PSEU|nr:DUF4383 domain-containing protein [Gandjariella thermophila]GDY32193.1 hypothetical protein GTS_38260 [Gandjariella thermophila]